MKERLLEHIEIREFNIYPDYSVNSQISPNLSKKQIRTIKENGLKEAIALQNNKAVKVDKKYYLNLPSNDSHHTQFTSYKGNNGTFTKSTP